MMDLVTLMIPKLLQQVNKMADRGDGAKRSGATLKAVICT